MAPRRVLPTPASAPALAGRAGQPVPFPSASVQSRNAGPAMPGTRPSAQSVQPQRVTAWTGGRPPVPFGRGTAGQQRNNPQARVFPLPIPRVVAVPNSAPALAGRAGQPVPFPSASVQSCNAGPAMPGTRPSAQSVQPQRVTAWTGGRLPVPFGRGTAGQRRNNPQARVFPLPIPRAAGIVQRSWSVSAAAASYTPAPSGTPVYSFSTASAIAATQPLGYGAASSLTSRTAASGVAEGDVASYGLVQYLEQVGDGLTGDHQPSGAAIKEAIRQELHNALPYCLTRLQAQNAYKRAITVVVTSVWHKASSKTYSGRNTKARILLDAADLFQAAVKDFEALAPDLKQKGWSNNEIQELWDDLENARQDFYATGRMQAGTLH